MARFHGKIGYAVSEETAPGVWTNKISEREYYGDVIREARNFTRTDQVNDDLEINNRISVVADDFARENLSTMRYVVINGVYWRVSSVEIQRPRVILSLGGPYNGNKA